MKAAILLMALMLSPDPKPQIARGEFDVKLTPLETSHKQDPEHLGRMSGEKVYHGELEGTGVAELLTGGDPKTGSAAIVGMEKITGKLRGRSGTFIVHHTGVMEKGKQTYSVGIVPDSGTGELAGISGKMVITIEGKKHFYALEYSLK
jgi:hypothetical protein